MDDQPHPLSSQKKKGGGKTQLSRLREEQEGDSDGSVPGEHVLVSFTYTSDVQDCHSLSRIATACPGLPQIVQDCHGLSWDNPDKLTYTMYMYGCPSPHIAPASLEGHTGKTVSGGPGYF